MNTQELLSQLTSEDKLVAKIALRKLQENIIINNELLNKLLSEKTQSKWNFAIITGQELNKMYQSYISRYGIAFINENHPDFNKIQAPGKVYPKRNPQTVSFYNHPNNILHYSYTDKINTNKNLIVCEYGTTLSSTERHSHINKITNHNWLCDLLASKGYIDIQTTLTKFNAPEQVDFIISTLDEYLSRLINNENEMIK